MTRRLPSYPLQYGDISGNYTNILFIDNSIDDLDKIIESINLDTFYIIYSGNSSKTDLLNVLQLVSNINRIGFFFSLSENKIFLDLKPFYDPLGNYNEENDSTDSNFDLLVEIINLYNIKNVDFLACNTLQYQKWNDYYNALIEKTNVIIGASDNETGNIKYGGDWILESTGQDIEFIYFNQSIEYYKYLLDNLTWVSGLTAAVYGIVVYNGFVYASVTQNPRYLIKVNTTTAAVTLNWSPTLNFPVEVTINPPYIYTCLASNGQIVQLNLSNGSIVTSTWVIGSYGGTGSVYTFGGDYMYIVNGDTNPNRIQIANLSTRAIINTNWFSNGLYGAIADIIYNNGFLYVSIYPSHILKMNPTTAAFTLFTSGLTSCTGCVIVGDYIYALNSAHGTISQIDLSTGAILNATWKTGLNTTISITTDNVYIYTGNANGSISQIDLPSSVPVVNVGSSPTRFYYDNVDICNNFTSKTSSLNPLYNSSPFFTGFYTYYNGSYYDFAQVYNINSTLIPNPLILNNMYTNYNGSYYELNSFFNPNSSVVSGSGSYTIVGSSSSSISGSNYIYTFISLSGTLTLTLEQSTSVTILCIGGGGGGGWDGGGGGGGGGAYSNSSMLAAGTYTITIGSGGIRATGTSAIGSNGGNSRFIGGSTNIICYGGGGGGNNSSLLPVGNGGNGGGQGANSAGPGGTGVTGQGNNGGAANFTSGGGGGGYSSIGVSATGPGGNGGNGILNSITGSDTWYGGGGGGGSWENITGGTGGLGGGGNGGSSNKVGTNANGKNATYYGGGGGGGGNITAAGIVAGNGYQGICIISIPTTYIPRPTTLFSTLTTPSTNWNGVFSLKLLVSSYTGFTIKIRRTDNTFMSFYSTTTGVLTSGINGTGTTIATFLSGSTGFVDTWYDQSGKGNNATQTTTTLQPIMDLTNNCINFGLTSGNYYLNMPSGTVPVGVLNASYSFVVKHGNSRNLTTGGFIGSGIAAVNSCNSFRFAGTNRSYQNYWYGNDFAFGNAVNKIPVVAAVTYDKPTLTQRGYRDGVLTTTATNRSGVTNAATNQTIGVTIVNEYLQGQMYSLLIFSSSLPQSDITILNSL